MSERMRGDAALALGAQAAGVRVVTGYPGSPATGTFDALLASPQPPAHIAWAPNEKVAMELAYGASLGGARALVVLKSVGLNVALDPLATMALSGCRAGLVILLGDDPGGWSSQNEQDSRWAARVAEVPIVEPLGPEQAAALMSQAFVWSEAQHTPIIVRITSGLAAAEGTPEAPWPLPRFAGGFYRKRNRWVVLPANVVALHRSLHRRLDQVRRLFDASPYDLASGRGGTGVLAVGHAHAKVRALLPAAEEPGVRLLGLTGVYPLPESALAHWLRPLQRLLVVEEGGPFVEQALRALVQRLGLTLPISGRDDDLLPAEGELATPDLVAALAAVAPGLELPPAEAATREMPSRVPLCDDCPYRPTFDALLAAMERRGGRRRHIIIGETGCMVRAHLPPTSLFDVKYSLGSGLGLALGTALSGTRQRIVALVGDSSFYHSGINALPHAAHLNLPLLMVVLDNGTTALTGGQPHPGSDSDDRGRRRTGIDVSAAARGCGVEPQVVSADNADALRIAFDEALTADRLRLIVVRGPCPRYPS